MILLVNSNPWIILIGICFGAIAGGSVQALMTARLGDLVKPTQRGKAIGNLHTAGDLGSALGPITAYALLGWLSLNGIFILCALLFALSAGFAWIALVRKPSLFGKPIT